MDRKPETVEASGRKVTRLLVKTGLLTEDNDVPAVVEEFARPLLRAGQLYLTQHRTRDAERTYRRALARRPNDPDVLVALSQLLDDTGRSAEAESLLEQALAVDPESPTAHYRMAWNLRDQGKDQEAIAHYKVVSESLGRVAEVYPWTFEASDEDVLPVDDRSHAAVEALRVAKGAEASGLQALEQIVGALG